MGHGARGAVLFAEEGARVVVCDINKKAADETVTLVEKAGGQALAAVGDVAVEDDVKRMVDGRGARASERSTSSTTTRACCGRTRTARCSRPTAPSGTASWPSTSRACSGSPSTASRTCRRRGGGSIILVGSVSALAGFTRAQDAYTAAKGALISLNKSLAIQFAKDRIRSNIIHPGIVETPLQAPYLTPELRAEFKTGIPLGRIGQPRDIAYAALFLASEESSFMTGAEMIVDGGFMAQ